MELRSADRETADNMSARHTGDTPMFRLAFPFLDGTLRGTYLPRIDFSVIDGND